MKMGLIGPFQHSQQITLFTSRIGRSGSGGVDANGGTGGLGDAGG